MEPPPGGRGGFLWSATIIIMRILEIAGAVLLLALGVLWLALLLRIRLKLSAIEKELTTPRKNTPRR